MMTLLKKATSHPRIKQMKRMNMSQNLLNPLNPLTILGSFRGVVSRLTHGNSPFVLCPFLWYTEFGDAGHMLVCDWPEDCHFGFAQCKLWACQP